MEHPRLEVYCPYCEYIYNGDSNGKPHVIDHKGNQCPSCMKSGAVYPPYSSRYYILKLVKERTSWFFDDREYEKLYVDESYVNDRAAWLKSDRLKAINTISFKNKELQRLWVEFNSLYAKIRNSDLRCCKTFRAKYDSLIEKIDSDPRDVNLAGEALKKLINEANNTLTKNSNDDTINDTIYEVILKR